MSARAPAVSSANGRLPGEEGLSWVMDLDERPGDQGRRTLRWVRPGDEFTVEMITCESVATTIGTQVTLRFDPSLVSPVVYKAHGREGLFYYGPRTITDSTFTFAVVSLTPIPIGTGSLALATFRTLPGFTGETRVILVEAQLGDGDTFSNLVSTPNAGVTVRSGAEGRSPDFDGDGTVAFADFLEFGRHYGSRAGDSGYDVRFDLDGDETIGFADFLIFGRHFD